MRAAVSVELPAAKGTTTVTGRVGQPCADANQKAGCNDNGKVGGEICFDFVIERDNRHRHQYQPNNKTQPLRPVGQARAIDQTADHA